AGTGNGLFSANSGGIDFGDSVLKLKWSSSNHTITVSRVFSPWDEKTLDNNDTDLGSGGVLLLPDQLGTKYPHLLLQAGKEAPSISSIATTWAIGNRKTTTRSCKPFPMPSAACGVGPRSGTTTPILAVPTTA